MNCPTCGTKMEAEINNNCGHCQCEEYYYCSSGAFEVFMKCPKTIDMEWVNTPVKRKGKLYTEHRLKTIPKSLRCSQAPITISYDERQLEKWLTENWK